MPGVDLQDSQIADRLNAAIVDTVIDAIVTIDNTGSILTFNRAAERIFGYHPNQVVGQPISMLMPEPYASKHQQFVDHYINGKPAQIIGIGRELHGLRKDGTQFPMYLGIGEARINGARLFTGIIRDLTDVKKQEAELEAAREELITQSMFAQRLSALAEMAGGISHELNQPLSSIRMYTETLRVHLAREAPGCDKTQQTVDKIIAQVERAANVIQHMREFASATPSASPETVALRQVVEGALDLLGSQLRSHGILLQIDVPEPLAVCGSPYRLEQVVTNLVANARDALSEHHGSDSMVSISAYQRETSVCLRIADNGPGIPQELVHRIYEPFMTTKGPDRGTGLGLAIVHGILREHNADIALIQNSSKGATFELTFPLPEETPST